MVYSAWFLIPGEPTGKGRPRVVHTGGFTRTYTPEKTVSYENLVKVEFERMCRDVWPVYSGPLKMHIRCNYSIPKSDSKRKREAKLAHLEYPTKKPDVDNIAKIICDALNGVAYKDDTQIVGLDIEKYYDETPSVLVGLETFDIEEMEK